MIVTDEVAKNILCFIFVEKQNIYCKQTLYKTWTTTYKQRDTTMKTYKAVARARQHCDLISDH